MHTKHGFTLIELLIVVAIIGILAAIAVPNFLNAQLKAKVARVESDVKSISTAMEMYRLDKGNLFLWGANWGQTWRHLTSPISYMSITPMDIFQPKHSDLFVNAHNWYEYSGCNGRVAMKNLGEGGVIMNYVIASLGPDSDDDTINISDYPNAAKFMQYAASNGLVSDGDILKETKSGHNPLRSN